MNVPDLIKKRRSIRKFLQKPIKKEALIDMIEAARLAPSAANLQPIKYVVIHNSTLCKEIFPLTKWAGYIDPHGTPKEGETPTAYIVVLLDTTIRKEGNDDASLASANIIYTALSQGIASCIIGSVDRKAMGALLNLPKEHQIHTLIALGYPNQESVMEDSGDSIKYYLDENGVFRVPKRKIEDISRFID